MNIFETVQGIFRELFDDDSLNLTHEMIADDIEGWNSLMHINIIAMCENDFGCAFDIHEIIAIRNVGDLLDAIERKVG
jgi:acyl carrier protein